MGLYAPYFYFFVNIAITIHPNIAPKNGPKRATHIANIKMINANLGNMKNSNSPNINNNIAVPPLIYLLISYNAQIISMNIIIPIKNGPNNNTKTINTNNGKIVMNNKCLFFHNIKIIIKHIIDHIVIISFNLDYYKCSYLSWHSC